MSEPFSCQKVASDVVKTLEFVFDNYEDENYSMNLIPDKDRTFELYQWTPGELDPSLIAGFEVEIVVRPLS